MPNSVRKQRVVPLVEHTHVKEGPSLAEQSSNTDCSFKILSKIGQGGYGSVYVVEKNQGIDKHAVYAMKVRDLACLFVCLLTYAAFMSRSSTRKRGISPKKSNTFEVNVTSCLNYAIHLS